MFEVGAKYEFHMVEGEGTVSFVGIVEEYEHPLIKLKDSPPMKIHMDLGDVSDKGAYSSNIPSKLGQIINVTSPQFVSAQRLKDDES